jgi:hypothetical protein
MRARRAAVGCVLWASVTGVPLGAQRSPAANGTPCGDPARPCPGFAAHDLSFVLPRDEIARAETASREFWAVLLASGARCSITEARRRRVQAHLAARKVFSNRFECDDESPVRYEGASERHAFLAVHAGTRAQAIALADSLRRSGAYPGANARRMRAVRVSP